MAEQIKAKVFGMDAATISLGDDLAVFDTPNMLFYPVFVMCTCISESRVFLIRRP